MSVFAYVAAFVFGGIFGAIMMSLFVSDGDE